MSDGPLCVPCVPRRSKLEPGAAYSVPWYLYPVRIAVTAVREVVVLSVLHCSYAPSLCLFSQGRTCLFDRIHVGPSRIPGTLVPSSYVSLILLYVKS